MPECVYGSLAIRESGVNPPGSHANHTAQPRVVAVWHAMSGTPAEGERGSLAGMGGLRGTRLLRTSWKFQPMRVSLSRI